MNFLRSKRNLSSLQTVLRIWDCLFYEGSKVLLRVALTLIILNKDKFMQSADFNAICNTFKVSRPSS